MAPQLLSRLGLPIKATHITTHNLDCKVNMYARKSPKMAMTVQYMEHIDLVYELEVLVVPIRVCYLVL